MRPFNPRRFPLILTVLALIGLLAGRGALPALAQGGTTGWSVPINFSQQLDTFSDVPVLLCDNTQNVHVFWVERESDRMLIFNRNDVGASWSNPVDVMVTGPVLDLFGVIAPDNTVHLMWNSAVHGDLVYSHAPLALSADARGWPEPVVLVRDTDSGSLAVDKNGVLHAVYGSADADGLSHTLYYIHSDDGGATWSEPTPALVINTPVASATGVMIKADGQRRLHIAWQVRSFTYGEYSRIGYLHSTDLGRTWSTPIELGVSETLPGVAIPAVYTFGDDEIHLTYDIPDRMYQWSKDGGQTWSQPVIIMKLGGAFGGANVLVKDSAGTLHVVSAVSDGVYHAAWSGNAWNPPEAIDRRYYDPHHQQMVVCQGNQLHVVYDDRRGENEIWYATKRVNAPLIPQKPIPLPPTPTPLPTLTRNPLLGTARPGPLSTPTAVYNMQAPSAARETNPLIAPIAAALALIVAVAAGYTLLVRRS
jgi:hypothetical protein